MSEIKEKIEAELKPVKSMCETMENAIKTQLDKGLDKVNTHEMYEAVDIYKDLSEVKKNIIESCYKMQIIEAMEEAGEEKEEEEKYMLRQMKEQYGDEEGQKFYNDWRYANGRYAPKGRGTRRNYPQMYIPEMEWDRDMDRYTENRMYYSQGGNSGGGSSSGGSSRGYSEGYSDGNQRGYEEGNKRGYDEGYQRGYREGQGSSSSNRSYSRYDNAKRGYEDSKTMHAGNTAEDNNANVRKIEELMDIISEDVKELLPKMTPSEKTALKSRITTLATHVQ